jgi:large subunit ribosomal protein L25
VLFRSLQGIDHVQARALPTDLPPLIEVDISGLDEIDQAIHVSDLTIPENLTVLTSEEELVAKITTLPVEEVVEEEEAAEAEAEGEAAEAEGGAEAGEEES